eukprot:6187537-Pleurochrysis_carterae.AAC.3
MGSWALLTGHVSVFRAIKRLRWASMADLLLRCAGATGNSFCLRALRVRTRPHTDGHCHGLSWSSLAACQSTETDS